MGMQALFVEHPTDTRNRVRPSDLRPQALPWETHQSDPTQWRAPC